MQISICTVACSEKQLFLNFKQLASFSHYVTIQELPKKILELSLLQKQGPRDPAFQGEKLYIYYMNIAQNYPKIHVSEKTAFLRSKNDFQPKTKVVPNTSSNCKTNKKIIFSKKIFLGGCQGSSNMVFLAFFAIFGTPKTPQTYFF